MRVNVRLSGPQLGVYVLLACGVAGAFVCAALAGDAGDGDDSHEAMSSKSRSRFVHRLTLYDHDGVAIDPTDQPAQPYSPSMTCGKCHPVGDIARGWHFNAMLGIAEPGRPGEPWIIADRRSGTVMPLSQRGWRGTSTFDQAGLSWWDGVMRFGRHIPGGGFGGPDQKTIDDSEEWLRWGVSGNLEIDCMMCHSLSASFDPAEAARQIERENFRWVPTASMGLAVIRGEAKNVPDDWDPYAPPNPDYPDQQPPKVIYDESLFDGDNRVFFDIGRRPPSNRCYYCHTTAMVGSDGESVWPVSTDVHMAAGLVCADCHGHDVGHSNVRGYRSESKERQELVRAQFSCEGCHLGSAMSAGDGGEIIAGRFGAPHPLHRGLPTLHFDRLTCTACHSGPLPKDSPNNVQTSLAHGLGIAKKDRRDDDLPHIVAPILAKGYDGRVGPHRMIWPAFWGRESDGKISPLTLDEASRAIAEALGGEQSDDNTARDVGLSDDRIVATLKHLAAEKALGKPVYVRDGYAFRLGQGGGLEKSEHVDAAPYLWSMGHDVRPAAQSIGSGGCTDCHSGGSPFFYGKIAVDQGESTKRHPVSVMHEMEQLDPVLLGLWSTSFDARPLFKWVGGACAVMMLSVVLVYGFRAFDRLLRRFG